MKTLLLLRHAKSSKDDTALRDFDRPLNDRGKDDTKLIGRFMRESDISPDAVISSPAKRARTTTELVLKSAGLNIDVSLDERIYEADVHRLLAVVSQIEPTGNVVMLVGHNPGFEDLVEALTGRTTRMPTASLAQIDLVVEEWNKVRAGSGKLKWLVTPKDLKKPD
ncbi:MAG TPA: histidine phosphatase family protein [Pyrinomonadaceae bacterium]|nr:histidine phosphatase family protein [Pyrinomonadaceae bacterium]